MVSGSDSHRCENVVSDRQKQQSPDTEEVREKCEGNQQVKDTDRNHVLPQDSAMLVHHSGFGDAFSAYAVCLFDVDVLGLQIPFGQVCSVCVFLLYVSCHSRYRVDLQNLQM